MPRKDQSVLASFFGETPFIKVLDTLLDHPNYDYTKKELAEVNDISRPTVYKIWDKLERLDLVTETRKIGNTQLYKLNTDNKLVEKFIKFEREMEEDQEIVQLLGLESGATETTA